MNTSPAQRQIVYLERRYNGDNDLIPNAPIVTYADNQLLEITDKLLCYILELEQRIIKLEKSKQPA